MGQERALAEQKKSLGGGGGGGASATPETTGNANVERKEEMVEDALRATIAIWWQLTRMWWPSCGLTR